jgi:hypothetical protein
MKDYKKKFKNVEAAATPGVEKLVAAISDSTVKPVAIIDSIMLSKMVEIKMGMDELMLSLAGQSPSKLTKMQHCQAVYFIARSELTHLVRMMEGHTDHTLNYRHRNFRVMAKEFLTQLEENDIMKVKALHNKKCTVFIKALVKFMTHAYPLISAKYNRKQQTNNIETYLGA